MNGLELKKTGRKNYMMLEIASQSENLSLARIAAASFASQLPFTMQDIEEIKVAVSEAVSNCIIHAYDGQADRLIRIQGGIYDHGVEFLIQDWGCGIADIEKARQPAFSNDPERMGLGFVFMESFMDQFRVQSKLGAGTIVHLVKNKPVQEELKENAGAAGGKS